MYCQKCGQQIDDNAVNCAHCGAKTMIKAKRKKPLFKKWWFWLIVVLLGLMVIGAAGGEDGSEEAAPASSIQTDPTQGTVEEEPAVEPTDVATEPQGSNTIQLGSMQFDIPNDVEITAKKDSLYTFALVPNEAYLSVFATDAAELGSDGIDLFILLQHQAWMEDGAHSSQSSTTLQVGTSSVSFDQYDVTTDKGALLYNMVGTFTDNKYIYILFIIQVVTKILQAKRCS